MHRLRRRARQIPLLRHASINSRRRRSDPLPSGFDSNSTDTATVCPSTTGTRLQCALTFAASGSMRSPRKSPRIFCVSCCIFSSSPPMNGTTLAIDVHRRHARIARARNRLHRGHHARVECRTASAEPAPSSAPQSSSSGWSRSAPSIRALALLHRNQLQMIRIDLRHQQRHIRIHAMVLANWKPPHVPPARTPARFPSPPTHPWPRTPASAHCPASIPPPSALHDSGIAPLRRQAGRLVVRFAGGPVARAQPRQIEPRMVLQKLDKMLAHHAGGAQYCQLQFWFA